MFCIKCGNQIKTTQKFCTNCGTSVENSKKETTAKPKKKKFSFFSQKALSRCKKYWSMRPNIMTIIYMFIIGFMIYGWISGDFTSKNTKGIEELGSGNSESAEEYFTEAVSENNTKENQIILLKNLAYSQLANKDEEQSLNSFKEALKLTTKNSFDYYYISGEISELEGKFNLALQNYNKAYELVPLNFQINNALALFYLNGKDLIPQYEDYKKALFHGKMALENSNENMKGMMTRNLAAIYFWNENYDKAISLLSTENIDHDPASAFYFGMSYFNKEDSTEDEIMKGFDYMKKAADAGFEAAQIILNELDASIEEPPTYEINTE